MTPQQRPSLAAPLAFRDPSGLVRNARSCRALRSRSLPRPSGPPPPPRSRSASGSAPAAPSAVPAEPLAAPPRRRHAGCTIGRSPRPRSFRAKPNCRLLNSAPFAPLCAVGASSDFDLLPSARGGRPLAPRAGDPGFCPDARGQTDGIVSPSELVGWSGKSRPLASPAIRRSAAAPLATSRRGCSTREQPGNRGSRRPPRRPAAEEGAPWEIRRPRSTWRSVPLAFSPPGAAATRTGASLDPSPEKRLGP